jgi:AcrR family transcriptional regulator
VVRPSLTRQRIQAVARELFAQKGVQNTSLQEIADRLGITKPALYYHFASREDLVRSIVQPLIDDGEAFLQGLESEAGLQPRTVLERYFDFIHEHRELLLIILAELPTLSELGIVDGVLSWRRRLTALLFPPEPTPAQSVRAAVALGGLQDCPILFPDAPVDELRRQAVDAACAALGVTD